MDTRLLDLLVCPVCKAELDYRKSAQELVCKPCKLAYPIRDDIPIMLPMKLGNWPRKKRESALHSALQGGGAGALGVDAPTG